MDTPNNAWCNKIIIKSFKEVEFLESELRFNKSQMGKYQINMASLEGQTIASTYKQLLKITSEGVGADASAKYIEDGLGTDTALSLSTTRVGIGSASPAYPLDIVSTINNGAALAIRGDVDADGRFSGIQFGDNGTTSYSKGGIFYEGKDAYARGNLHFPSQG